VSRGLLISFEGLDGSGKTTQMALLADWLEERSIPFIRTREPGGTPLGVEIRQLLFGRSDITITPLAEAFLFQSDRAQHFETVVLPALEQGTFVITDRCYDSSIAYQGAARGVGTELVERLSLIATQGHTPDLTILLDLDPAEVAARTCIESDRSGLRQEQSRFDLESLQFHQDLRQAFLYLVQAHPQRIKVIDALQPPAQVHRQIITLLEPLLKEKRSPVQ
jgi:dTMP kinase